MVVHRWEPLPLPLASSISYHVSSPVWLVLSPLYLKVWCLGSSRTNLVCPFIVLELEPRLGGFCMFREVLWLLLLFILIASSGWFPSDSFEVFAIFWVSMCRVASFRGALYRLRLTMVHLMCFTEVLISLSHPEEIYPRGFWWRFQWSPPSASTGADY